ncbi:DUF1542 domain-containing protein [Staphylococcus epidermidis]
MKAETDTTVNEARDNGTKLIATDVPNPTKKAEARAAVTNSANSKIKDINNNTQATLDERNDAIALVNRSKDEAIQNINTAKVMMMSLKHKIMERIRYNKYHELQ